jgi:hypothetical protein
VLAQAKCKYDLVAVAKDSLLKILRLYSRLYLTRVITLSKACMERVTLTPLSLDSFFFLY